ncbi:penicillin-binding transpeptidase domain-containing protein [Massilia sp. Dwa41.01b]|uniref:penicillin-binding transpeptidase domain-containing protein n=1 Tax=Massilia sp. Dwa41.01b TaxID=2709302 RepID=UPI001E506E4B|nr:penicillin-binding transpeptidase domain-containing protein [Massilia sp. Dwa41.01b]
MEGLAAAHGKRHDRYYRGEDQRPPRHPLWQDGATTAAARGAGLSTLLGLHPGHAGSIAGMLGRLPASNGEAHAARLTLDLALQRAAQGVLDCVGLRRGSWDGARCQGGGAVPSGRQAGLVLLDTGSGDILAAASAGAADTSASAWEEVRDFDRADPARSPLRQAALQHDGGAERSPGSTFKIVTALGLELAAQRDPRLDALLSGMALPGINRLAAGRGFAFRTDAATYPSAGSSAHITNFRDQQLDRRAKDGKLGLAEALGYSLNTWFAWTAELSDASLFGRPAGGAPSLRALDPEALAGVRPVADMARRIGFERSLRLDGGLLPPDYGWRPRDALEASVAAFDPIGSRHELRQMAIGLRMQATPLHMALAAGAVGEGRAIVPRMLRELDGRRAVDAAGAPLGVRLDRIRAGLHGVVTEGTAAGAFRDPAFAGLRAGLYGKTGTAPVGQDGLATVWFTGWLEPGSLPGQSRRLAFAAFVSRSGETGGAHAAPVVAALLRTMAMQRPEPEHN